MGFYAGIIVAIIKVPYLRITQGTQRAIYGSTPPDIGRRIFRGKPARTISNSGVRYACAKFGFIKISFPEAANRLPSQNDRLLPPHKK